MIIKISKTTKVVFKCVC